ncbi:hypothetical protein BJX65DRAFT_211763 [Aspergillus insuetus]
MIVSLGQRLSRSSLVMCVYSPFLCETRTVVFESSCRLLPRLVVVWSTWFLSSVFASYLESSTHMSMALHTEANLSAVFCSPKSAHHYCSMDRRSCNCRHWRHLEICLLISPAMHALSYSEFSALPARWDMNKAIGKSTSHLAFRLSHGKLQHRGHPHRVLVRSR